MTNYSELKALLEQDTAQAIINYVKKRNCLYDFDEAGYAGIYHILKSKHASTVIELLKDNLKKIDMTVKKSDNVTALHIAAQEGHTDVVKSLLSAGAGIEKARTNDGVTPLLVAAYNGHPDMVKVLLSAGADINKADIDDETPLFISAQNGHADVVKTLLSAGADINKARTLDGATPLLIAAQEGHIDVVKALIAFGIDINVMWRGVTPLLQASRQSRASVVKVLAAHPSTKLETLQRYANDDKITYDIKAILRSAIDSRLNKAELDDVAKTALEFWPKCPISRDYIVDPVRASDNHTYERAFITRWMSDHHHSPSTNGTLNSTELVPDFTAIEVRDKACEIIDALYKAKMTDWQSEYDAIKEKIIEANNPLKPASENALVSNLTAWGFFRKHFIPSLTGDVGIFNSEVTHPY